MPKTLKNNDKIPASILSQLSADAISLSAAVKKSGLHRNSFYRRVAKMISVGMAPESLLNFKTIRAFYDEGSAVYTPDIPGSPDANIDKLRTQLRDARNRARDAETQLSETATLGDIISGLIEAPASPPAWLEPDYLPHLDAPSVPVLMVADWHLGETVDPATSYGYSFNVAIAEKRVEATVTKATNLLRNHITGTTYPGIVAAMVGDLVSGSIHQELAETDELNILPSIIKARDLAIGLLDRLKSEFGRVFVPCATGNHGRIQDRRPRAKGYAERNADWLIYQLLASHYADDPDVTVVAPKSGETVFKLFGKTFLLTHGDQIGAKGGDGIIGAIGPIMRGNMKTTKSLESLGVDVDHILMGHYHQQLYLPRVTVSGCLKGPDEYAIRLLRCPVEDPSQTLLLVHPEHGVTFRQPIFLRDEHCPAGTGSGSSAADQPWVSWVDTDAA